MNLLTFFSLSILWIVLNLVAAIQPMKAQNESLLTGSNLKSEDVAAKADALFIGQITGIGFGDAKAKGEATYRGVQVKVLRALRGNVDFSITVTLRVFGIKEYHEDPPKLESLYIFFVKKNARAQPDSYTVLKLLPATPYNVAKVKTLIAAAFH